MKKIPVLGFSAYSGTGKTTLIEKLVRNLKMQGLRVAVLKHDVHGIEIDREGKDSWRFAQAGAEITIVSSAQKTAYIEQRPLQFEQVIAKVHDVDLILVEGYKKEPLTQIGICRKEIGKDFPDTLNRYAAIVTDIEDIKTDIPKFGFEDIDKLTEFIIKNMDGFTQYNEKKAEQIADVQSDYA